MPDGDLLDNYIHDHCLTFLAVISWDVYAKPEPQSTRRTADLRLGRKLQEKAYRNKLYSWKNYQLDGDYLRFTHHYKPSNSNLLIALWWWNSSRCLALL